VALTSIAGLAVSWFHPWQGLTLLVLVFAVTIWARLWGRVRVLAIPVLATLAPLVYYEVLSRTHSAWRTVSASNNFPHFGDWLFLAMIPLLVLAAPGWGGTRLDLQQRLVRLWPVAAFVVYLGLQRSWIYHAFVGVSLPLAILAVNGWRRLGIPTAAAAVAIAIFTIPGAVWYLTRVNELGEQHFLMPGEARAMRYLASLPGTGGVLARVPLGTAVPAFSGRNTWVGHPTWTPDYTHRTSQADALFGGRLGPPQSQALVRQTGARFLLADCRAVGNLRPLLGSLVLGMHRFGCAAVYEVR
jgi:hypothetical protein